MSGRGQPTGCYIGNIGTVSGSYCPTIVGSSNVTFNINTTEPVLPAAAACLPEVVPDKDGSYAGYKIKPASPTKDMLNLSNNYRMCSECKGLAFILNNNDFGQNSLRGGSHIDTDNIKHLFEELGFKIVLYKDLTGEEITQHFKDFASMFNKDYDAAVIVLMSHGGTGFILGTDGERVNLRDLQRELEPDKCPNLKEKPKMYYVQACRGSLSSIVRIAHDGINPGFDAQGTPQPLCQESPQVRHDFAECYRDTADVHVAYSTTDGYLSLRSEVHGSFFVQALCEVFFRHAHEENLDTLMTKVTGLVNSRKGNLYDHDLKEWVVVKQTPECVKRLCKTLYFLPKFPY